MDQAQSKKQLYQKKLLSFSLTSQTRLQENPAQAFPLQETM